MGETPKRPVRGGLGIARQAEFFEALMAAVFTCAPGFLARYAAAVRAEFPALGHSLDDGSDTAARDRRAAMPAAYAWMTGAAPALQAIPPDILQLMILFATPWVMDPDRPPPQLCIGAIDPAIPLPAPRLDLRASTGVMQAQAAQAVTAWLEAARTFPTPADRMRAGSLHLTPEQAWATVPPWPAMETHAQWWVASRVEGAPYRAIAGHHTTADDVRKAVTRIDARLGLGPPDHP